MLKKSMTRSVLMAALLFAGPQVTLAQENVFAPGWTMDTSASVLRFQSVKNETKVESSTFATYTGTIDENGLATIRILLDSVDTAVDLRNVRMRFLLFETFQFPEAVITMQIDPAVLADLQQVRRKVITATYTIDLHGVTSERQAEVSITLLGDNQVLVSSATPISLLTTDFNLDEGIAKLEEAAKVDIIPGTTVSFDFIFNRAESESAYFATADALSSEAGDNAAAMEEEGELSMVECSSRFVTMSESNSINFSIGSARLTESSRPILHEILDIVNRCPSLFIQVAGHTDSDGSAAANQALSEARARSVRNYLVTDGADANRIEAVGLGESMPAYPNDTAANKQRNRRIEFSIMGG